MQEEFLSSGGVVFYRTEKKISPSLWWLQQAGWGEEHHTQQPRVESFRTKY